VGHRRDTEHKPSSVVIPNTQEGKLYLLSSENRKRDETGILTRVNNNRYNSRPFVQRKREEDGGVPGTIDIMVRILISLHSRDHCTNRTFHLHAEHRLRLK